MSFAYDPAGDGLDPGGDIAGEAAALVTAAIDAREAAHTGAALLGRALAVIREPGSAGVAARLDQAISSAAGAPDATFRRVLRWMAGAMIGAAELAGEALGKDPGVVVGRVAAMRSLTSRHGHRDTGVGRALSSVVQSLACDAPGAERALDGLADGLDVAGRSAALAWTAELTVGLLATVCLATEHDEADLLAELAEGDLLDPVSILSECGVADRADTAAPEAAGPPDADERTPGDVVRTAAAERRAIGVLTAYRSDDDVALDAALSGLSRLEIGELCSALAGCVAGAAEVTDALLDELVDGVAPFAVGHIVDQAGAIGLGIPGVTPNLRRWLHVAEASTMRTLVHSFAHAAWSALVLAAATAGTDPCAYLQSVGAAVAAESAANAVADDDPCPCRSGADYGRCCGR